MNKLDISETGTVYRIKTDSGGFYTEIIGYINDGYFNKIGEDFGLTVEELEQIVAWMKK